MEADGYIWESIVHFRCLSSESQNFRPSMHALICSVVHFQDLEFSILSSHSTNGSNADIAQRCLTDSSGKIPTTPWADTDSTCSELVIYPFPEYLIRLYSDLMRHVSIILQALRQFSHSRSR